MKKYRVVKLPYSMMKYFTIGEEVTILEELQDNFLPSNIIRIRKTTGGEFYLSKNIFNECFELVKEKEESTTETKTSWDLSHFDFVAVHIGMINRLGLYYIYKDKQETMKNNIVTEKELFDTLKMRDNSCILNLNNIKDKTTRELIENGIKEVFNLAVEG